MAIFVIAIIFCLTPWATPPIALATGVVFALLIGNPYAKQSARATRILLQACIVGLGFGIHLRQVVAAGRTVEEVVVSVKRVSELISEIAAASQEQSQGIEQVTETMTQME